MKEFVTMWNLYIDELVTGLKPLEMWLVENKTPEEGRAQVAKIKGSFVGFMEWLVKKI